MSQIIVETKITIQHEGQTQVLEYRSAHTGLTAIAHRDIAIAADGTPTLWDPTTDSTETVSDFDFLLAVSDGTLDLEKTANEGHASETVSTIRLFKDLPYMLGADDAYYDGGFSGTLDVIDKLRADDPDSAARKLKLIMAT